MPSYPAVDAPIKKIGLREVCESNGRNYFRREATEQWIQYAPESDRSPPVDDTCPLYLSLVLEEQGPGEPFHWSLFVAREKEPGFVYQAHRDAEYMSYEPSDGPTDIVSLESFSDIFHLATATDEQALVIKEIAELEPPRAPNRWSVTENCQGWAVRVIAKLVDRGIVSPAKVEIARSMLQPV